MVRVYGGCIVKVFDEACLDVWGGVILLIGGMLKRWLDFVLFHCNSCLRDILV